ncbi:PucR family transcriptional regulator ligand-binding domain-containing protein [Leucobacter massiliensis]|uniref:Fis family transcriptional regulator n=1 Tax=Leucobacter massiliensis TaxID=1686285 RepID=A0A2S9QSH6_9MICO|nr:PucR family transcriptional regulator ligand-binding domain-containing protein [Leucobacter massiliensis]PRI12545.1 Fis family transcriptional regulator [Leucobacter massiliensis]PRI12586.1 Fis family transcriptional regulator [Leucobacter massiliensis]
MALLSQLLNLPDLGLRLVQAGPGDPEISWSSTTELLDLGAYLEGGEIILTTGLALAEDDPRWRDFVASLSRARVAAIGFGIGVNHARIPPPLSRAASEYRVALFEIPLPVPFIAVTKAIAALLRSDELRAARAALQAQQRLLDGARSDRDPAEVLASIAQATGKQLAVVGSDGSTLASTGGFAAAQRADGAEYIELDPAGALRLAVAGGAPATPEGSAVIAAGSMVLGLGLRSDHADTARERGRWGRLTAALLGGEVSPGAVAILDPELRLPERLRAVAVQGTAEDVGEWRRRPRTGLDRLIAAEEEPPAPGLARAWQLAADEPEALERLLAVAAAHGLDVVVGRPATPAELPLSRRSAASRVSELSTTAPLYAAPRVPETVWADRDAPLLEALLAVERAGRAAPDPAALVPEGATLSSAVLGPLSLRETRRIPEPDGEAEQPAAAPLTAAERETLRETLRAVFEADGQRGPAATRLGIHRNTLRDRLSRIERLTGRSLGSADDRSELWLALRLEELGR